MITQVQREREREEKKIPSGYTKSIREKQKTKNC